MGPVCGLWFAERDQTVAGGGLGMTVPIAGRQMQFHLTKSYVVLFYIAMQSVLFAHLCKARGKYYKFLVKFSISYQHVSSQGDNLLKLLCESEIVR